MAVDTDGGPGLEVRVEVLADALWLGAQGVADKVDGGRVVVCVAICVRNAVQLLCLDTIGAIAAIYCCRFRWEEISIMVSDRTREAYLWHGHSKPSSSVTLWSEC